MTVDLTVIPGLLLLGAELLALAAVGYVVARVALRQTDDRLALAQGLVIGLALWGLSVNFVLHLLPGLAGTLASWIIILALAGALASRDPATLRIPPRTLAGFTVAALALFWVVLASRQLLSIVDQHVHLSLAASIREGIYPPEFPWTPGVPAPYHYGPNLLVALLAPPGGPDLAFTTELMDAYAWISLALILIATVARFGTWITVIAICPLFLSFGLWTQVHYIEPPGIVQAFVPLGLPEAGLRASLADIFWPTIEYPRSSEFEVSPANIWRPHFVLAYALAFAVLERVAAPGARRWLAHAGLALAIGFLGLVDEVIAVVVLSLWMAVEALQLILGSNSRPLLRIRAWTNACGPIRWRQMLTAGLGPGLATLLLITAGGTVSAALFGTSSSEVSIAWIAVTGSPQPTGSLRALPGGVGLLQLGALPVVAMSVLLGRQRRLVLTLAAASALLFLGALTLRYEFSQSNVVRLDGHARNFALAALLVALAARITALPTPWRYAAAALIVALVTWPTAVAPVANFRSALALGPHFANASNPLYDHSSYSQSPFSSRYPMPTRMSAKIAEYIREQTPRHTRILSPFPTEISIVTGRPNASGLLDTVQFDLVYGPEYLDAIRFLEPTALNQLGISLIHAPIEWTANLPDRAQRWLSDPSLFELLLRDSGDSLYRVRPAFFNIDSPPSPESFNALQRDIPASSTVYMSAALHPTDSFQLADALSHTRLLGRVRTPGHIRTNLKTQPLGEQVPDLVVTPSHRAPSGLPEIARLPIWWNDKLAIYALGDTIGPIMTPPSQLFTLRVSKREVADGRITFRATFTNRVPQLWTGQDWLVMEVDASPWSIPREVRSDGITHDGTAWFAGQMVPALETLTLVYEFDPCAVTLAVMNDAGVFEPAQTSGPVLNPSTYALAVRLQNGHREAAVIPVMEFAVLPNCKSRYLTYGGSLSAPLRTWDHTP